MIIFGMIGSNGTTFKDFQDIKVIHMSASLLALEESYFLFLFLPVFAVMIISLKDEKKLFQKK